MKIIGIHEIMLTKIETKNKQMQVSSEMKPIFKTDYIYSKRLTHLTSYMRY